jgi:hypothetical protein
MKSIIFLVLAVAFIPISWGTDYDVQSWRCGAPLVRSLRHSDPKKLLDDDSKTLQLKESLRKISESNMAHMTKKMGKLSDKEQQVFDLIKYRFQAPVIHRTSNFAAKLVLTTPDGLVSPVKRKAKANTPQIEQDLFAAHDCIFTSIGVPYGTERYGTTILRLKQDNIFGWATLRSGYHWIKNDLKFSADKRVSREMKNAFAEQIITEDSWDVAMAYQLIQNIRLGTSYFGQGKPYDKTTILDELLAKKSRNAFWEKVQKHRLAYLEGKHIENVTLQDLDWVQFRKVDESEVLSWSFPAALDGIVLEFYNRDK